MVIKKKKKRRGEAIVFRGVNQVLTLHNSFRSRILLSSFLGFSLSPNHQNRQQIAFGLLGSQCIGESRRVSYDFWETFPHSTVWPRESFPSLIDLLLGIFYHFCKG